ncbi:Daunorubicin/doxorubicin resistance ATP-binding protein DrrA [Fundidesulfovibrio magnetotacticus]|uniref:Daunorubicin/doxorubicin resistance ATP-binding protein DrrA n=1 Tax=Fundidesulfovibrio magnetotacticus TaxID=2730080 RepID=A0A6V8LUH7_9BACT|nr:ABC transporter ATP-binding protein [Fundidesulfovibrio magnetotacticus]GFK93466.1 Daunorubicin/doxorubicin resistance ATP-binding protein DrrA [Fundidesulfovibrio magnetotacticus]
MNAVVEAVGLRKHFAGFKAVDGLDLRVEKGRIFGLLGPNGAGKTSTIRMIYGFSPRTGGELRVFGQDVARHWRAVRARLGVCQQDNALDPDLTVRQNLLVFAGYFAVPGREAKRRADELLAFFALEAKADADVRDLSGGMARRLMLARSLVNEPELLILDEPTTGLDPQSRHLLWDRLRDLREKGLTILLTTHYLEEAATLCDDLLIMDHGKALTGGAPADIVASHAGRAVLELVDPEERARAMVEASGFDVEDFGRRLLVFADGFEELETLRRALPPGQSLARPSSLEDVFLRLTGRDLRE